MWTPLTASSIVAASHPVVPFTAPPMDVLMVSGFFGSILTLLFWMHQGQSRKCVAALAICLAGMAVFGFIQGAWPLGIMECVWSIAAFRRSLQKNVVHKPIARFLWLNTETQPPLWHSESRISRLFN
jgi:hypothetical protein